MMENPGIPPEGNRIGFVSTRLAGSDGVSLEVAKWVKMLEAMEMECFFFAGESEWPAEKTHLVPEAHFAHEAIEEVNLTLMGATTRSSKSSRRVYELKSLLKEQIEAFVDRFDLDLLIAENVLSLPMNIPLGLALTEFIAERDFPVIAHHHDFAWERQRYAISAASDYLRMAFPPTLRSVRHVVLNSFASRQLALRTGSNSALIPNVMDFETPPAKPDEYAAGLRADFGIGDDDYLMLQPTRIVPRKRIELAINLAHRMGERAVLLISHEAGDEGLEYKHFLEEYAESQGVRVLFGHGRINHVRRENREGRKVYSLADAYAAADIVTYPSRIEGFGNAVLEAVYYRRPLVMSAYEIFKADIQPKGFRVVEFDDYISDATVRQTRTLLDDGPLVSEMVSTNYELGRRFYSFRALAENLLPLLRDVGRSRTQSI
jgi:glycosyltransferase involved in cell wall biosynthesis